MTKLEQVARAICAEIERQANMDGNLHYEAEYPDGRTWVRMDGYLNPLAVACAAISAMREPTPEMCVKGFLVPEAEEDPAGVFRAMIDQVLADGK